jgi:hypothetical protein
LEQPLADALGEFPLVREQLGTLAVRNAAGRNDEGAELYVNDAGERTALLALKPERLAGDAGGNAALRLLQRESAEDAQPVSESTDSAAQKRAEARAPIALVDYLRHEFTHLHDMLDPAFGYSPVLDLRGLNAAQKRLACERYRLLWDITIDGRLSAAGHTPMAPRKQHALSFARGCSFWPEQKRMDVFASFWRCRAPRHSDILALITDPRSLRGVHRPEPGASCPLCNFSTFHWADANSLPSATASRITAEFPEWLPDHGLCHRCLEAYQVAAVLA